VITAYPSGYAGYTHTLRDTLDTRNPLSERQRIRSIRKKTIANGLLEFKGHGKFGELLHDSFDETMVIMETMEKHNEIEVMTTWHNNETLADVFWQCFFATCLPDNTNYENIKIVCSDLDGINRTNELQDYIYLIQNR